MVTRTVGRLALSAAGLMALSAAAVMSTPAPAHADSFAFGYSSGYYPRHHHRSHGYGERYVYVAPPPVYYYPPPPRVVYGPPPAYYPPPPVVYQQPPVFYQQPQTLPGGPLQAAENYCREYQSTTIVNNQPVPTYGTACQQPDGSWRIVR
jgi:hypothetical protein